MGTVIDHLMSRHRVIVTQGFTDANGVTHRAGESGLILQMGWEWPTQEIWIEWERDGAIERMTFRLDAREGPRSGAMHQFFEMGDYVPLAAVATTQDPAPTTAGAGRSHLRSVSI